eukprot:SAG31_NODE_2282_length_6017_cov_16.322237_1_plen_124_part_10
MQDPDEQLFRKQAMSLTVRPLRSQQHFVDSSIIEGDVIDGSAVGGPALEDAMIEGRPVLEDAEVGGPVLEDAVVVEGHGKVSGKDACMEPPSFDRKLDDRSATELLAAFSVFSPINFAADVSPF